MADTPLSSALKSAIVAAAEAHLADVTTDVNRVKAAIQADLPSVSATAVSIEALVKAEVAKLKADVVSLMPTWMKVGVVAVASVGGGLAVHMLHLFG